jgi:calcium-dependent protein kinase
MRAMDDDNIIKMYSVYESDKYIHFVLEYLDGGALHERIHKKGHYNEKDAAEAMKNILKAI